MFGLGMVAGVVLGLWMAGAGLPFGWTMQSNAEIGLQAVAQSADAAARFSPYPDPATCDADCVRSFGADAAKVLGQLQLR